MAFFGEFSHIELPKSEAQDSRGYWKFFIRKNNKRTDVILEQDNKGNHVVVRKRKLKQLH